jgi:DNA-directed RNA polymerase subunit RPC12/RpoP
MKLKGTVASNVGTQTAWACGNCGAIIAVTQNRGKPLGDCPSCTHKALWSKQDIPIAVFDN